jgi:hypothetical protein
MVKILTILSGTARQSALRRMGEDQGDVVVLFGGAELAKFVDYGGDGGWRRVAAVAAEGIDQARLAKLFVGLVEGFGDAVGVEYQSVAGGEVGFAHRTIPGGEEADHRAGGFEAVDGPIAAENERREMAAVGIA